MERADGQAENPVPVLNISRTEGLSPVANLTHTAISETAPEVVQPCDERGMNNAEAEKAYEKLYEEAYPVPGTSENHHNWSDGGDGEEASLITDTAETPIPATNLAYYQVPKTLSPLRTDDRGNTVIPDDWYETLVSM